MHKLIFIAVLIFLSLLIGCPVYANEGLPSLQAQAFAAEVAQDKTQEKESKTIEKPKCLVGIEVLAGYSEGNKIRKKENMKAINLMIDFDLDIKPLLNKINLNPPVLTQFVIEPYFADLYKPVKDNFEGGLNFLFKLGLVPESWAVQPYAKFGVGLDYMTLHTLNQSTQFNFTSQAGFGVHYFFMKNTALTVEGRYRHLSNAGIKSPNRGINSYFILGGLSWRFN